MTVVTVMAVMDVIPVISPYLGNHFELLNSVDGCSVPVHRATIAQAHS